MISVILTFLSMTITVVWSVVFLPVSLLGIRVNKVSGAKMKTFLKSVTHSSIWINDEPSGWICGKYYIGFVNVVIGDRWESKELWLVSTKKFYDASLQQKAVTSEGRSTKITYFYREGSFWRLNYACRQIATPKQTILPNQENVVAQIIAVLNTENHAVCLLHGSPGTGKSMVAQFLCAELLKTKKSVSFCNSHAPYEPCDNFNSFYAKVNPTEDAPLVVVFEEVDGLIGNLHCGKIVQGDQNPIQIKQKTDWNTFLDEFDRDLFPHVVLLMTTNQSIEWFDALDPSYMRSGRVNLKIAF